MANIALEKVLKEIKQKVSEDIIVDFDDKSKELDILGSWGSMLVDQIAPLVKGRVYELYGAYSSGKSTLAITACADVVKKGGIAAYIDAECAFNAGFAETLGLDISSENFILLQPENEEWTGCTLPPSPQPRRNCIRLPQIPESSCR